MINILYSNYRLLQIALVYSYFMSNSKKCFSIFVFLFGFICNCFSDDFDRYVLENNLELYTIQDKTSPISKVYYISEAGFSKQTKENTGFFELYSNIFWSTNPDFSKNKNELLLTDIEAVCNADESVYSYSLPSSFLAQSLEMLSNQLKNPFFPDSIIKEEFSKAKKYYSSYEYSPEGFINGSIDSRVFSAPWKQDTGINPKTFISYKHEKVKSILVGIAQSYYAPNNSALVIVSPFTHEEILEIVKKYFESWPQKRIPTDIYNKNKINNQNKKYILLSEDFSKDLTQIIVQYTDSDMFSNSKNITASQMACIALENNNSLLKNNLYYNRNLGILAKEYINTAFSYQGQNSRIIIQALMQNTDISPIKQTTTFLDTLNNSIKFSSDDISSALRNITGQSKIANDSAFQYAKALSYNWVYEKNDFTKSIQFLAETVTEDDMKVCFNSQPFVFLLLHPQTFQSYKEEIEKNGFELITQSNSSWYKQKEYLKKEQTIDNTQLTEDINLRVIDSISSNSGNFKLKNDINVNYSLNQENSTATLTLLFEGGEINYGKDFRGLQTILLKSLGRLIEIEINKAYNAGALLDKGNVIAQAGMNYGTVSISCTTTDFINILPCITKALIYGEITPAMEDELVYMEKSKWRYLNSQLDYQLVCKALTSFYKGEGFDYLFSCTSDILSNISFNDIQANYTSILNSSRISLIVTGNPGFSELSDLQAKTDLSFGMLKPLSFTKYKLPQIQFIEMTQISRLKRIFTTNIKAEDAGPRPEHLIPTTEFLDPAIVFIQCPEKSDVEYPEFALLLTQLSQSINQDFINNEKSAPAKNVSIIDITETTGVSALQFNQVKSVKELHQYFSKKCSQLKTNPSEKEIQTIKTYWISNEFMNLTTNDFLATKIACNIQQGLDPLFHIQLYKRIQQIDGSNLPAIKEKWLSNPKLYWLFSADTKK